jgi:hypothetical protein
MSLPPSTYGESGLDLTASPINLWQRVAAAPMSRDAALCCVLASKGEAPAGVRMAC